MVENKSWQAKFDLVYECRNIQALPISVRFQVIQSIVSFVAKSGNLLLITRYLETKDLPSSPPWPVSEEEISQFGNWGLVETNRCEYIEGEKERIKQLRIQLHKQGLAVT